MSDVVPPTPALPPLHGGRERTRKAKLLLGLTVTVAILALLEAAVRVRERVLYGTFSRAGTTIYEHAKDGTVTLKPGSKIEGASFEIKTNSLGFVGPEPKVPKPAGTYRIVCLGGSTTFDTLAHSDEERWPARLERLLRKKHPGVEVVNTGVPGHKLTDSLSTAVWSKVFWLQPDLIVCYHAINDLLAARVAAPESAPPGPESRFVKGLTDWSLFAYKVKCFADSLAPPPDIEKTGGEVPERGAREFEANLRELVKRARTIKSRLAFGTFAIRWRPDQPLEERKRLSRGASDLIPGLSLSGIEKALAAYNEAIERVARDSDAALIPVAAELSGHEEYFGDVVHHSSRGSEKMAAVVAASLEASGALER